MVEIETISRIPIYGRLFFQAGSSYISAVTKTSTKFGLLVDFDLWMRMTLSNTKPEVVLSHRCRYLELHMTSLLRSGWPDWDEIW